MQFRILSSSSSSSRGREGFECRAGVCREGGARGVFNEREAAMRGVLIEKPLRTKRAKKPAGWCELHCQHVCYAVPCVF
eukprot:985717-Pelagomonas_calceolata.AAC.1